MRFWQFFPLFVALLAAALNAWISIQVKFAPTRDDAVKRIKSGVLSLTVAVALAVSAFFFVRQILSSEPVTRWSVFLIAVQVAGFFALALMHLLFRMMTKTLDLITRHVEFTGKAITGLQDSFGTHLGLTETIANKLLDVSKSKREPVAPSSPPPQLSDPSEH